MPVKHLQRKAALWHTSYMIHPPKKDFNEGSSNVTQITNSLNNYEKKEAKIHR